jgi:hypothetical protein
MYVNERYCFAQTEQCNCMGRIGGDCMAGGWVPSSQETSVYLGLSCNMRDGGKPFLSEADIPGGERLALRRA